MRNQIITEVTGYDPIHDGIDEVHLARVRVARKKVGLPTQVDQHPFRKVSPAVNQSCFDHIIFGSHPANQFEII